MVLHIAQPEQQLYTQTGTAGGTYTSPAGVVINATTGDIDLVASTPGTYTVTYSFTDGTCSNTTTASITITALPTATIAYNGSPYCATGTATVTRTGTAGGTYTAPAGVVINAATGDINLVTSTPGTYTITYSFTSGECSNTTTASITITALPTATIAYTGSPYCATGTATVTQSGTAGGTYTAPLGVVINALTGDINLATSTPGTYTITYSFTSGGCSNTATTSITINARVTAIASAGTVSCNNGTTQIFVIASGGSGTYTYSLNGGTPQPGFVFTVGAGGPYTVTVTDGICSATTTPLTIANPTEVIIGITSITPSGCGGATGSFSVLASGGAGSYTYSLNGGGTNTTGLFTGLAANSYLVTAKDANGCTAIGIVTIPTATPPIPFTVTSDPNNCTGLGVHIRLGASQLGVNYQLYLNGAIDGPVAPIAGGNGSPIDFGPQPSGTYTVVATSTAGCVANMTGSVTVNSSSLPIAYSVTGGGSYCSGGLGLHVGLQNSETGVNYQVFNGATVASGIIPGKYRITD